MTTGQRTINRLVGAGSLTHTWPNDHWNWPVPLNHAHGVRSGHYMFSGGQAALDAQGTVQYPNDLSQQCGLVFGYVKRVLDKVTTFYQGCASAAGLHQNLQIRSATFGSPGPATSGISVPHLVYPHMIIEIEVIAVLNGE